MQSSQIPINSTVLCANELLDEQRAPSATLENRASVPRIEAKTSNKQAVSIVRSSRSGLLGEPGGLSK